VVAERQSLASSSSSAMAHPLWKCLKAMPYLERSHSFFARCISSKAISALRLLLLALSMASFKMDRTLEVSCLAVEILEYFTAAPVKTESASSPLEPDRSSKTFV